MLQQRFLGVSVQIKSYTRKTSDLWSRACVGITVLKRSFRSVSVRTNLQMFLSFGPPSLLLMPRTAHGLHSAAGQELLHHPTYTQPTAVPFLLVQDSPASPVAFSWHWVVVNVVHNLFRFLKLVHHIAFYEPITAKLILQPVSDAVLFAHVMEMYFLVCWVCEWMIPCVIKGCRCMLYL